MGGFSGDEEKRDEERGDEGRRGTDEIKREKMKGWRRGVKLMRGGEKVRSETLT